MLVKETLMPLMTRKWNRTVLWRIGTNTSGSDLSLKICLPQRICNQYYSVSFSMNIRHSNKINRICRCMVEHRKFISLSIYRLVSYKPVVWLSKRYYAWYSFGYVFEKGVSIHVILVRNEKALRSAHSIMCISIHPDAMSNFYLITIPVCISRICFTL